MEVVPSCATTFLCAEKNPLSSQGFSPPTCKAPSPPRWRAASCCLKHTQGGALPRDPPRLPQMLQDSNILLGFKTFGFFLSLVFAIFSPVRDEDRRCQVPSPNQPCSAEVGDGGYLPAAGPATWGQGQACHGDRARGKGRRQVAAGSHWPHHDQRGQKPPGRNQTQSSMREQCISLLTQDFNEHVNLMFKWLTG